MIAVECPDPSTQEDSDAVFRTLILQKDQQKIKVKEANTLHGLEACRDFLAKHPKIPVLLCLWNGFVAEGMIDEDQVNDPIGAVMGIQVDSESEFAIEMLPAAGERWYTALIRNNQIEEQVAAFADAKDRIAGVCISRAIWMYALPSLLEAGHAEHLELILANGSIFLKSGLLAEEEDLRGENYQRLTPEELAPAAGVQPAFLDLYAASLWMWSKPEAEASAPYFQKGKEFTQVSLLKNMVVVGAVLLGVWAFSLLSLRIRGEQRKAELEATYSMNLPVLDALSQLDEKISQREALQVKLKTNTLAATRASFYLDRLAALTPPQIKLRLLSYGPGEDDIKRAGAQNMGDWDLIVQGASATSAPVADFNTQLEAQNWVQQLKVLASGYDFQSDQYRFTFLIRHADV